MNFSSFHKYLDHFHLFIVSLDYKLLFGYLSGKLLKNAFNNNVILMIHLNPQIERAQTSKTLFKHILCCNYNRFMKKCERSRKNDQAARECSLFAFKREGFLILNSS